VTHRAILTNAFSRERFKRIIDQAPAGYVAEVKEPTRTLDQNNKLWAMLTDVSVAMPLGRRHTPDDWKAIFMSSASREQVSARDPQRHRNAFQRRRAQLAWRVGRHGYSATAGSRGAERQMGREEKRLYTVGPFWLARREQSPFFRSAGMTSEQRSLAAKALVAGR
jgi:hypothetical protein